MAGEGQFLHPLSIPWQESYDVTSKDTRCLFIPGFSASVEVIIHCFLWAPLGFSSILPDAHIFEVCFDTQYVSGNPTMS